MIHTDTILAQEYAQLSLPLAVEVLDVHCFFHCGHVTQSANPQEAHDLMEQHYTDKHARQIERLVGPTKRSA